jgi:hypothetical protein
MVGWLSSPFAIIVVVMDSDGKNVDMNVLTGTGGGMGGAGGEKNTSPPDDCPAAVPGANVMQGNVAPEGIPFIGVTVKQAWAYASSLELSNTKTCIITKPTKIRLRIRHPLSPKCVYSYGPRTTLRPARDEDAVFAYSPGQERDPHIPDLLIEIEEPHIGRIARVIVPGIGQQPPKEGPAQLHGHAIGRIDAAKFESRSSGEAVQVAIVTEHSAVERVNVERPPHRTGEAHQDAVCLEIEIISFRIVPHMEVTDPPM